MVALIYDKMQIYNFFNNISYFKLFQFYSKKKIND